MPSIDIKLKIPHLGNVVSGFTDAGFHLADEFLSSRTDEVSEIDLILGVEYSYCIPEHTVTFGSSTPSVFGNTSLGVMLMGDMSNMLKNLLYLPACINDGTYSASASSEFPNMQESNMETLGFNGDVAVSQSKANLNHDRGLESRLSNLEFHIRRLSQDL